MGRYQTTEHLTENEQIFVNIYPLTYNVYLTARKCGITNKTAFKYLRKPAVKAAIATVTEKVAQRCEVTAEECMNELYKIAFFDHKSYLEKFSPDPENGEMGIKLKDLEEMDTSALQEISVKVSGGIPYIVAKPYNKVEALKELMNRLQGTNGDRHLHLHLSPEEMKKVSAQEAASTYQQLVQKAIK
jgi:hypothetical protein